MDAKKLENEIRRLAANVFSTNRERAMTLKLIADAIEEAAQPAPAKHWFGPFEHHGGECQVPPETLVQILLNGHEDFAPECSANCVRWDHLGAGDIISFSYVADNPEGWLPRPEGWVPPEEAYPLQILDTFGRVSHWDGKRVLHLADSDTHKAKSFRLLPREKAAEPKPAPIPADTRALVREALEAGRDYCHGDRGRRPITVSRLHDICSDALAALDNAAPAELPEYARVYDEGLSVATDAGYVMIRSTNPEDLTRIATACTALAAIRRREEVSS